jgi:YVTN family beta-propeller protein
MYFLSYTKGRKKMGWITNKFKQKSSHSSNSQKKNDVEPYVGPRPFDRNDKDEKRFFGRDYEADEIVSLILGHRLVLVYAQSGAGKTSIINAKISPMLEESGFQVLPSARIGNISNSENYPSSKMAINSSNIKNAYMFNAIQSLLKKDVDPQSLLDKQQLTDFLKSYHPPTIVDQQTGEAKNQVLVFDQSEELFTFYPNDKWREQQKDFFQQITKALKDNNFLRIVIVIREDYLAELDPFLELLPERLRPRFRLERLQRENALLAIKNPLEEMNPKLYNSFKKEIDTDIDKIIDDLLNIKYFDPFIGQIRSVKGQFIEPIHLQIVCQRWWKKKLSQGYKNVSNHDSVFTSVDEALKELYESTIKEVVVNANVPEEKIRKWCEKKLITRNGTRGLVYLTGKLTDDEIPANVIDILVKNYLIRSEWRSNSKWYELTHDRLIGPIKISNQNWFEEHTRKIKVRNLKIMIPSTIAAVAAIGIIIMIYTANIPLYEDINSFEDIRVDQTPYMLAVNSETGYVYLSHPFTDSLSVIDGKTNNIVNNSIKVGDQPNDIEVNPISNELYVTHPQDGTISIIDLKNYILTKSIKTNGSPYFIALNLKDSKLYASNVKHNSVSIIDLDGEQSNPIHSIGVGAGPTDIEFNPNNNLTYVINSGDNTISVIDEAKNKEKRISTGHYPASIEVNPTNNKIYVTNNKDNTLSVIDGTTNEEITKIIVGQGPAGMEINPKNNEVYVTNSRDNTISVIDGSLDIVVATLNVGKKPIAVGLNDRQNLLYVSDMDDASIRAIDMKDSLSMYIVSKIPTGINPSGVAIGLSKDNKTNMIYTANTDSNSISVINGTKNMVKKVIPVKQKPIDVDINNNTRKLYVSHSLSNALSVIDTNTETVEYTINSSSKNPKGLLVDNKQNVIYVTDTDSNSVSVINATTKEGIGNIKVGNGPTGIAVDPSSHLVYVTNTGNNSVSVINATTKDVIGYLPLIKYPHQGEGPTDIVLDLHRQKGYIIAPLTNNMFIIDLKEIKQSGNASNFTKNLDTYIIKAIPNLDNPHNIVVNSKNGKIYVTSSNKNLINIIQP